MEGGCIVDEVEVGTATWSLEKGVCSGYGITMYARAEKIQEMVFA